MQAAESPILFWLAPLNDKARECVNDPSNIGYVACAPDPYGGSALVVSFESDPRISDRLLSLGKLGDVTLEGDYVSKHHIEILLHWKTWHILIRDISSYKITKIQDPVDPGRVCFGYSGGTYRQAVIRHGDSIELGLGGAHSDLYRFKFVWPRVDDPRDFKAMEEDRRRFALRPRNPRLCATEYETLPAPSRYELRVQPPAAADYEQWLHCEEGAPLGRGSFGTVSKTLNLHTGEYFAVKKMWPDPTYPNQSDWRNMVKREVENLLKLSHPHVVAFYHSQGWPTGLHPVEIFMALHDGNLQNLVIKSPERRGQPSFIRSVCQQMLKALAYIASKDVVHRDVKPQNIMYTAMPLQGPALAQEQEQNYRFVLADFGLAKEQHEARTARIGTRHYMAPEMLKPGAPQSHKVDVYSLGVTLLVITGRFEVRHEEVEDTLARVQQALRTSFFEYLRPMLEPEDKNRLSAQEAFLHYWPTDPSTEDIKQWNPKAPQMILPCIQPPTTQLTKPFLAPVSDQQKPIQRKQPPRGAKISAKIAKPSMQHVRRKKPYEMSWTQTPPAVG